MTSYTSKPYKATMPASEAYGRLSNTSTFRNLIDKMPPDLRAKLGEFSVTDDSIVIGTPQLGNISLKLTERVEPSLITFQAENSPVPIGMSIHISPDGDDACSICASIDVEIPAMLRPMIGGKLQEAADRFGEFLGLLLH